MKKKLAILMVVAAVAGPGAAFAAGEPSVGAAAYASSAVANQHTLAHTFNARTAATGVSAMVVTFDCTALALPTAASTGINTCSLQVRTRTSITAPWGGWGTVANALNTPSASPGPVHEVVGAALVSSPTSLLVEYRGCVDSEANYMETVLGPADMFNSDCGNVLIIE